MQVDFDWWMAGMRGHERYEENKLYPYLAVRYGVSFDALEDDHVELNRCKQAVQHAFKAVVDDRVSDSATFATLLSALRQHQAFLHEHLAREEDQVIPLLLSLSPDEFHTYYNTPIDALLDSATY